MQEAPNYISEVKGKTAEQILASADCPSPGPKGEYLRIAAQVRTNQEASSDSGRLQHRLIILTVAIAVAGFAQAFATAWPRNVPSQPDIREVEFRLRAECGIQAEKVVAQAERQAELKNHQFNTKSAVFSSQNHYNKALNRCLILITSGNRENYGMITEVLDAFEHSRLLVCSGDLHTGAKKACQGEATYTTPTWLTLLTPPEVPISEALSRISSYFRD